MNTTQVKAVLMDFDGTLVDSLPFLYNTYIHFLKSNGHTGSREELNSLTGTPLIEVVKILAAKYPFKQTSEELFLLYTKMLNLFYSRDLKLFPGAYEFIRFAKGHNLKLAIVTSAPKNLVDLFLQGNKLVNTFDLIITYENVQNGKPHPEIYKKALNEFHISPQDALAIEDSQAGVLSACGAHIPTIMLTHGGDAPFDSRCRYFKNWHEVLSLFQSRT